MTDTSTTETERVIAEERAWRALAGYKFWMFGYHAAQWVMLNRLLNDRQPNPFSGLVKYARERMKQNA